MNKPFAEFLILACLFAFIKAFEYTVDVGAITGENLFFPRTLHVSKGDTITFFWLNGNHSIIESDARASCTRSTKPTAFFAPATDVFGTEYAIDIEEESGERWFYCGVGQHCENGMYGIIYIGQSTDNTITPGGGGSPYTTPGYTSKSTKSFGSYSIIGIIGSLLGTVGLLFGIFFFLRWIRRRRNLQNPQPYTQQTFTQTNVENVAVIFPNNEAYNQGQVVGNVMPNYTINNHEHVIDNVPNHEINNHGQVLDDEVPNNEVHHHGRE